MKLNRILLLIGIGLLLANISGGGSIAINQITSDRLTDGTETVSDTTGILQLSGFNNSYVLNDIFSNTGVIVNNSTQTLQLRLFIDPNILLAQETPGKKSIKWDLTFRLLRSGGIYDDYSFSGNGIQNPKGIWTARFPIQPGEPFTVQTLMSTTYLYNYLFEGETFFTFDALETDSMMLYVADTPNSPRRHTYTSSRL